MLDTNHRNVICIGDLNQPIFRTYSKKWFLPILAKGNDALRNPSTWDDPFENFLLKHTRVAVGSICSKLLRRGGPIPLVDQHVDLPTATATEVRIPFIHI